MCIRDRNWGDIDYLFVDMPPGTSDVLLTVFQSLPVDGIVTVSAPQELVAMIVGKAVNLAHDMDVEVLGLVENMAYFKCDDCGKEHHILSLIHISPGRTYARSNRARFHALDQAFRQCAQTTPHRDRPAPSRPRPT